MLLLGGVPLTLNGCCHLSAADNDGVECRWDGGEQVLINNSCLSKHRGVVNGGAQTLVAAARMFAPTVGGTTFQWSVSHRDPPHSWPFNHYFIWYECAAMAVAAYAVSWQLPPGAAARKPENDG
jgi:hypothetical protein